MLQLKNIRPGYIGQGRGLAIQDYMYMGFRILSQYMSVTTQVRYNIGSEAHKHKYKYKSPTRQKQSYTCCVYSIHS